MENQIKDFPQEVIDKMLEYQVQQGNKRDISVFERNNSAGKSQGGFDWQDSMDGNIFWSSVIDRKYFSLFFDSYPKQSILPRMMLVGNCDNIALANPRVVFALPNKTNHNLYLAWSGCTNMESSKNTIQVTAWPFAWEIPIQEPIKEVTMDEVAKKFGVPQIKIVKQH